MVYATERHFERFGWTCRDEVDDTENPVGHFAHLIASARESALSAVSAAEVIAAELVEHHPGSRGDASRTLGVATRS